MLGLLWFGPWTRSEEKPPDWGRVRSATFDMVWSTVNDCYYDPAFGGLDWKAVRGKYEVRLKDAADNHALRRLLQQMLDELKQTHFAIVPDEVAVFTPKDRVKIGTVGTELVAAKGAVVVADVTPGSAAAAAGLRPGDTIRSVNGTSVERVGEAYAEAGVTAARRDFNITQFVSGPLHGPVGSEVPVEVEGADGKLRTVNLKSEANTGDWSEPMGNFPSMPIEFEARRDAAGIGYLKFSTFSPKLMKGIRTFIRGLGANDGLVIDLRGNPGGLSIMAAGISGWISNKEFSLGKMQMRMGVYSFDVFPQERAFAGPVAVLIDSGSASTSEILAAGLQEEGRARIFGETSAGAALPSAIQKLPTGDLFQYAIADLTTPHGVTLEGAGVKPDEQIARTREDIVEAKDPVFAAACAWIDQGRHVEPAK